MTGVFFYPFREPAVALFFGLPGMGKLYLELMWLINSITPNHGTIAGFVQKNKSAFHKVLRNLTLILKGWGLIDGQLIAIDGTKIRDQNSRHNCITQSGLDKKISQIHRLTHILWL